MYAIRIPRRTRLGTGVLCAIALVGCSDDKSPPETSDDASLSQPDAEIERDAGTDDGGVDANAMGAGDAGDASDASAEDAARPPLESLPYARGVVSFTPGDHAGFGNATFPDVVLGPPKVGGGGGGSLDVLSLGVGGEIVLSFGDKTIVDGAGPDFVVFENVFFASGDVNKPFAEPGQVSVSDDGATWFEFPCALTPSTGAHPYPGCAGVSPTLAYDPYALLPLDLALTGGDGFDLADLGLTSARFVRIHDRASSGEGTSAGFDLDAVGVIHAGP